MNATFLHSTAVLCVLAGAACLYAGTPRQSLLPRRWTATPSCLGAAVFFLAGATLLRPLLAPATVFFTMLATLMASLIVLASASALRQGKRR